MLNDGCVVSCPDVSVVLCNTYTLSADRLFLDAYNGGAIGGTRRLLSRIPTLSKA